MLITCANFLTEAPSPLLVYITYLCRGQVIDECLFYTLFAHSLCSSIWIFVLIPKKKRLTCFT